MDEYNFDCDAEEILKSVLRKRTVNSEDIERLADYLKAKYSDRTGPSDGAMTEKKPVGRPREGELPKDLPLVVAVFGGREAELGLRKKLADECGFDKNTAKARIAEARAALPETMAEPREQLAKLMASNEISSLTRKRDG